MPYVLFLDILGFAADVDALTPGEATELERVLEIPSENIKNHTPYWRIRNRYFRFHSGLRDASADFEIVEFSDSAFIVSESLTELIRFACHYMFDMYHTLVPVRGGIGSGDYIRMSFNHLARPNGRSVMSSPFLGSGIVRAYRAEQSGCKGPRILVHPSVTEATGPPWPEAFVQLPTEEQSPSADVELNLIYTNIWGEDWGIKYYLPGLARMRESAPERAWHQYDAAESALNRMRGAWGFSS